MNGQCPHEFGKQTVQRGNIQGRSIRRVHFYLHSRRCYSRTNVRKVINCFQLLYLYNIKYYSTIGAINVINNIILYYVVL